MRALDDLYELREELGRGAFGRVYLARDLRTDRDVAIKIMEQTLAPEDLLRFRREGELTAQLDHPGIVRVHGAGIDDDRPYLVYELVPGARTLDAVIDQGPVEVRAGRVLAVAEALAHAHEQGVIHRDVKPANILVDPEGRVRLADFGLATTDGQERLTETGAVLGTPTHMAPEQVQGERAQIGPPTDVWALGVLLYRALCGAPPFRGPTFIALAHEILTAAIPPPGRIAAVPRALEKVCLRALQRDPALRYPDAAAFAADLERALAAPEAGPGPRRLVIGMLLGVTLLSLVVSAATSTPTPAEEGRATSAAPHPSAAAPLPPPTASTTPSPRERSARRPLTTFPLPAQGRLDLVHVSFLEGLQPANGPPSFSTRVLIATNLGAQVLRRVQREWKSELQAPGPLLDVAVEPGLTSFGFLRPDGKAMLHSVRTLTAEFRLDDDHRFPVKTTRIALSPGGGLVAAGGAMQSVLIRATSAGGSSKRVRIRGVVDPDRQQLWDLAFIDGSFLVAALGRPLGEDRPGAPNQLVVLQRVEQRVGKVVPLADRPTVVVANRSWVVVGNRQGLVQAWSWSQGGLLRAAPLERRGSVERVVHHGRVSGLALFGKESLLSVSGSRTQRNAIALWSLHVQFSPVADQAQFLRGAAGEAFQGLAVDPAGRFLLIGRPQRRRVELWRLQDALQISDRTD